MAKYTPSSIYVSLRLILSTMKRKDRHRSYRSDNPKISVVIKSLLSTLYICQVAKRAICQSHSITQNTSDQGTSGVIMIDMIDRHLKLLARVSHMASSTQKRARRHNSLCVSEAMEPEVLTKLAEMTMNYQVSCLLHLEGT